MTDIVERLRSLSRSEHDDLSVGAEGADEIVRLREALVDTLKVVRSFSNHGAWLTPADRSVLQRADAALKAGT